MAAEVLVGPHVADRCLAGQAEVGAVHPADLKAQVPILRGLVKTCGNSPCMDWTGSDKSHLLGVDVEADEVAHGQDFVAAGALSPESHFATPLVAVAASSFPQTALLAGWTCVDRLGD